MEYDSLDDVIAHADEVGVSKVEPFALILMTRCFLVRLLLFAPMRRFIINLTTLSSPTFDPNDVVKAFSALALRGMTSRLARMAGGSSVGAAAQTTSTTPALPIRRSICRRRICRSDRCS